MIESILKSLSGSTAGELTTKAGIPRDKLGDVFKIVNGVATKEVARQAASGGLGDLMNLFSNKPNNPKANLIQNSLADGLIRNFTSKLGLTPQQAALASSIVVPALLNLVSKENKKTPENDPSPLQKIFELGGGKKGGSDLLGGLLGKFMK